MKVTIVHRGERAESDEKNYQAVLEDMIARLGPWIEGESIVAVEGAPRSTFSKPVINEAGKERAERLQDELKNAGVAVNSDRQLYGTGHALADVGVSHQQRMADAHAREPRLLDTAREFLSQLAAEKRREEVISTGVFGKALQLNGALTFRGYKLREQAVRSLLSRIESPALSYIFGLRDRIAHPDATPQQRDFDKALLLDTIQRECHRHADVPLMLRLRDGLGDIFAVTSPSYGIADANLVLPEVLQALPDDVRGRVEYDPISSAWRVKAAVFTATPAELQVVGEAFKAFAIIGSRDNGTGKLRGGGGVLLLACLNASTYEAVMRELSRVHRSRVCDDIPALVKGAANAITVLVNAWGSARGDVVTVPADCGEPIPGLFMSMLTRRRGALVGVLPGRTVEHVEKLTMAYEEQRRIPDAITRGDLAQGFTRYIQDIPSPLVRQGAESAIGRWLVSREPVSYVQP